MKKILVALSAAVATLSLGVSVHAQSIASCDIVEKLPTKDKSLIYKSAAPLRQGGPGTQLVGFRKQPTLIMNRVYSRTSTKIYDSQDNLLATCPWATARGHAGGRFRCTNSTIDMRRKAIRNTGSPAVFFVTNPRRKSCAYVPDAGRCYGSVKGLCDRTLK